MRTEETGKNSWWNFMTSSMKAAIHLGPDFLENSDIHKNTKFENIEISSTSLKKLIKEHSEEILNVKTLDYPSPSWIRSTLFNDNLIKRVKAKVCVHADSVLCAGKIEHNPGAADAKWTGQVEDLKRFPSYQDAVGLDGEAIEFEWKKFPIFTTLTMLKEIQMDLGRKKIEPENFKDRIIFMSMFNDTENCISNAEKVKNFSKRFLPGHWTFLGPGSEKKWYGSSYDGQWDCTANKMVQQFKETGRPIFTATSALSRAILRQRRGKSTIHFKGYCMNTELLFQQFIMWIKSVFTRLLRIGVTNLL